MTKLGKRYIAIVSHPNVRHAQSYPTGETYASASLAAAVIDDWRLRHCGCDEQHAVTVLEIDLDDAPNVDATLDEQHQHAERMATQWLTRYQELSAAVGRVPGDVEAVDERRLVVQVAAALVKSPYPAGSVEREPLEHALRAAVAAMEES